jgi:ribosomal protein S18 acetylase RimI-like enzyme
VHPLDNPVWASLTGPQHDVAERVGPVARYVPDVSSFGAFDGPPGPGHWRAMAELVGPGGVVIVTGHTGDPPDGWTVDYDGAGVQMTGTHLVASAAEVAATRPDVDIVPLGRADEDEMAALVALTRPGPFSLRTHELGGYVGVRRGGVLVAMAGQRFRPDGWCEISAVATHPDHRRKGLGELLVRMVAAGITARGESPFLHTAADNATALRLYGAMGFTVRQQVRFVAARSPGDGPGAPMPTLPPVHD